ncbi:MAG: aldo/keto reductase [Alphaproteobacteria bacterium]|nr:aldo/keto reductase [Alphaproteobacteria bacterium]MCB9690316.1 aldo/keto reductase [Alphaproteobacteria bacterium]
MEYRNLGNTGTKVSTLCLGTMTFGEADENSFMHKVGSSEATSFEVMDRALDHGVNFWDTADVYGQDGLSERVIGTWFQDRKRRDDVVLATKFRFRMGQGPNGTGASRRRIVRAVEDSLRRLQTDRIDLYQIHMQDLDTPEDELLRALDDLVTAGKVVYVGCSNYAAYRLMDSLWRSRTSGRVAFATMQMQYSLAVRDIEREHVPIAVREGVGILPWSPLAGGLLTGKYREGQPAPEGTRMAQWKSRYEAFDKPRNWRVVEALVQVAEEVGRTPSQVALAWLLHKPGVTSVIFGARTVAQLDDNLAAADLALSEAQMKVLDDASALEVGYPYAFMHQVQKAW